MKSRVIKTGCLFLFFLAFSSTGFSQESKSDSIKDRDWRIEVEPTSFVFRGFNLHVSRNITKHNNLNIGLYFLALDIPQKALPGMFHHVPNDADVRLGFEAAVVVRYYVPMGGLYPYVGIIAGWEYFDISHSALPSVRISTGVITPFIGHEIDFFKRRVFVNPQLRGVFYIGPKTDPSTRPEAMEPFFILPALSIGVRL
jgi:hypothetical protein